MSNEYNDWLIDTNQMLHYCCRLGIDALYDFATEDKDNEVAKKTIENIALLLGDNFDKLAMSAQNDKMWTVLRMVCECLILYSNDETGYAAYTLEEIYKYFPEEEIFKND